MQPLRAMLIACIVGGAFACDLSSDRTTRVEGSSNESQAGETSPGGRALREAPEHAPSWAVMTWNVEWFHHPEHGPDDDAVQYAAVERIVRASEADLIALNEISDPASFARLMRELPERSGVLAEYAWTQKVALVYRDEVFEVRESRLIEGFPNAGRPPLQVHLRRKKDGLELYVIIVHAKAGNGENDWGRRRRFAGGLKAHLDAELSDVPVIVAGDFNDRLSGSIVPRRASPYTAFVLDAELATPTRALHQSDEASHLSGETIDHILLSDELAPFLEPDSVDVRREELGGELAAFAETVSDHFPVVLRLRR